MSAERLTKEGGPYGHRDDHHQRKRAFSRMRKRKLWGYVILEILLWLSVPSVVTFKDEFTEVFEGFNVLCIGLVATMGMVAMFVAVASCKSTCRSWDRKTKQNNNLTWLAILTSKYCSSQNVLLGNHYVTFLIIFRQKEIVCKDKC